MIIFDPSLQQGFCIAACRIIAGRFVRYRKMMRLEQTFDVPTHLAFLERVGPQWLDEVLHG